ncbi:MAG: site-specific DNA-methyltransferase [Planctomycetes bacterium]|nr:site-specific DNA-methyltransferase [Planctomycetota bacterium]
MKNNPLPRLDRDAALRERLMPFCRLRPGDVWKDSAMGHRIACVDACSADGIAALMGGERAQLAVHDPPYNLVAFEQQALDDYIAWCKGWIETTLQHLCDDASLYVWLGADQNNGFQPLPDFMVMMRSVSQLRPRSFITMRNQRGYGTQKNWMAVRQELLYYVRGNPSFSTQYTEIPKILRGYYKEVNGERKENLQRSRSKNIRPGNVWVDVQQVFYRMQENVAGCYAQKPLAAIDRIVSASSEAGDIVIDFFAHSGTTLLSCERLQRKCFTADIDPIYCEVAIRRLERFRQTELTGWQNGHPFEPELGDEVMAEEREDAPTNSEKGRQYSLF